MTHTREALARAGGIQLRGECYTAARKKVGKENVLSGRAIILPLASRLIWIKGEDWL